MNKLLRRANARISLSNAAALLIGVALVGQALGFVRNRLVSANFTLVDPGASDAFFAAFQIPDFFFFTLAAGALGVAFIPILSDRLAKNDKQGAWEITSSMLNLLTLIMTAVGIIIFVFADPLMRLVSNNDLDPVHHAQAVTIMRIVALNPLFFTLSGIITTVQQTFGRFFFYALAPLFYNLSIIISIFIFRDNLGIVGLGFGALFGAVLQLLVASLGMFGMGFQYRPKIAWGSEGFLQVIRQLPARSIDQGIDQVNSIVEINRAVALDRPGAASHYVYATTLHSVPISLIGTSIATAAFPRLAERLSQRRPDLFRRDFLKILRTMIWMTMPVIVVAYFCRGYLARLQFGDGAPEVALILGYLCAAIFFRIVYSIVSRYFYAQKDTWTPLAVSVFAIGLNIILAFSWARRDTYDISGLALAQSFVAMSEVAILFTIMLIRDPKLFDRYFFGGLIKIISVTGFTLMAAFIMISRLPLNRADRGFVTLGTKLGVIAGVTLLVHFGVSWIFGLEEVNPVLNKIKKVVFARISLQ